MDPEQESILIYVLEEGILPEVAPFSRKVSSRVVKGLTLELGKLLAEHDGQF